MDLRRPSTTLAGLGLLLSVTAGCVVPSAALDGPARPEAEPVIRMASPDTEKVAPQLLLGPKSVLDWSVEPAKDSNSPGFRSRVVVGADGKIDLGPYGTLHVGGLTAKQASDAIMKHLTRYMKSPRVKLTAMIPSTNPTTPAVQPASHTTPRPPAHSVAPSRPAPTPPETGPALVAPGDVSRMKAPRPAYPTYGGLQRVNFEEPATERTLWAADQKEEELGKPRTGNGTANEQTPKDGDKKNGDKKTSDEEEKEGPPIPPPSTPVHGPGEPCGPAPTELNKQPLPPYRIEPPDILAIQYPLPDDLATFPQRAEFQSLVRPDGTVSLGIYGDVFVGGLTLDEARYVIALKFKERLKSFDYRKLNVDVLQYNSKFYYVITDFAGNGQNVERLPMTGNETVLDAISLIQLQGLSSVSSKHHIFVARRAPGPGSHSQVMKVDWLGITKKGGTDTNFQLFPGDRVYVCADTFRTLNTWVDKVITPLERLMGFTLLTSQTINSIRTNPNQGGGGNNNNIFP